MDLFVPQVIGNYQVDTGTIGAAGDALNEATDSNLFPGSSTDSNGLYDPIATQEQFFTHNEAELGRAYDLYKDNTKVQRQVQDMIAAGLNPATLSTGGFGVTSSGSGITASATTDTQSDRTADAFGNAAKVGMLALIALKVLKFFFAV